MGKTGKIPTSGADAPKTKTPDRLQTLANHNTLFLVRVWLSGGCNLSTRRVRNLVRSTKWHLDMTLDFAGVSGLLP